MPDKDSIYVTPDGILSFQHYRFKCAVGKGGVTQQKREGDFKTPLGRFPLREVFIRPDSGISHINTKLPLTWLQPDMGWCDDPTHQLYNQRITLPFDASHEILWREDNRYDIIIPLGYNDNPPVAWKGSAIFFHLASEHYDKTEGCIAISREDMLTLLPFLHTGCMMDISLK